MRIDDLHKRCPKCGQVKALADFYRSAKHPQGVQAYCRDCVLKWQSVWRAARESRGRESEREARRAAEDLREARARKGGDPW